MIFKKPWPFLPVIPLILSMICGFAFADAINNQSREWTANLNSFIGFIVLDQSDWGNAATSGETGLMIDFRKKAWPFTIAFDLLYSEGRRSVFSSAHGYRTEPGFGNFDIPVGNFADLIQKSVEMDLGIRKIWENHPVLRPFAGGGLSYIDAYGEVSYANESVMNKGCGIGAWVGIGNYFHFNAPLNIALEYRFSYAEIDMTSKETIFAGGHHVRFIVGYHW